MIQNSSLPKRELERLAALDRYDILDTPNEQEFDDLTKLASYICDTPVALITFIDQDRQWIKSSHGVDLIESPREHAICNHALGQELLEVADLRADSRFCDNPFVVGDPNARFYIGAPLVTPDGHDLGTICALDLKPRVLSAEQREALVTLSRQVVHQLELRRANQRERGLRQELSELITQRTAALRESEYRFQQWAEQSRDGFAIHVLGSARFEYLSPAIGEIWGTPVDQLAVSSVAWLDTVHDDDRSSVKAGLDDAISGKSADLNLEFRIVRSDETLRWVSVACTPIRDTSGRVTRIASVVHDITQRRQSESRLQQQQRLLQIVLNNLKEGVVACDNQGRLTFFNQAAKDWHGVDISIMPPDQWSEHYDLFETDSVTPLPLKSIPLVRALNGETVRGAEMVIAAKGEVSRFVVANGESLLDESGVKMGAIVVMHDVSEQREAQLALVESEARFRELAEQSSEVYWFMGTNPPKLFYVSPSVETVYGVAPERFYSDPQAWTNSVHPRDRDRVMQEFAQLQQSDATRFETEYRIVRPGGEIRDISAVGTCHRDGNGVVTRISSVVRDDTERKQADQRNLRTQRLESIGTLAGGVAHDLNNALAPVLMGAELLKMSYPGDVALIENMEAGALRGAQMVRQLLTFARGVDGKRTPVDSSHLIGEVEKMMAHTFPGNIRIQMNVSSKLAWISGDSTQLYQVLLNLCVNARDAMPEGGTLTLEAESTRLDQTGASMLSNTTPGRYIVIRVTDTGTGMSPETVERIFEPFFTTKGPDNGTGLGLSTLSGIVKSHGGSVHVESKLGVGSCFSVYLPVANVTNAETSSPFSNQAPFLGSGETILVVDENPAVRETAHAVLSALNFKVITATDGAQAIIAVAENRDHLRLVITEQRLREMDGFGVVKLLKVMSPQLAIVVASGKLDEKEQARFSELGVAAFLPKPYTQNTLIAVLRAVLPTPVDVPSRVEPVLV